MKSLRFLPSFSRPVAKPNNRHVYSTSDNKRRGVESKQVSTSSKRESKSLSKNVSEWVGRETRDEDSKKASTLSKRNSSKSLKSSSNKFRKIIEGDCTDASKLDNIHTMDGDDNSNAYSILSSTASSHANSSFSTVSSSTATPKLIRSTKTCENVSHTESSDENSSVSSVISDNENVMTGKKDSTSRCDSGTRMSSNKTNWKGKKSNYDKNVGTEHYAYQNELACKDGCHSVSASSVSKENMSSSESSAPSLSRGSYRVSNRRFAFAARSRSAAQNNRNAAKKANTSWRSKKDPKMNNLCCCSCHASQHHQEESLKKRAKSKSKTPPSKKCHASHCHHHRASSKNQANVKSKTQPSNTCYCNQKESSKKPVKVKFKALPPKEQAINLKYPYNIIKGLSEKKNQGTDSFREGSLSRGSELNVQLDSDDDDLSQSIESIATSGVSSKCGAETVIYALDAEVENLEKESASADLDFQFRKWTETRLVVHRKHLTDHVKAFYYFLKRKFAPFTPKSNNDTKQAWRTR